jgi:hypothetical protein
MCCELGDSRVSLVAVRYAVDVALTSLQHGIETLAREQSERESEAQSVWHKPKSPPYLLGIKRRTITKIPACPACEQLAIARDRAVGELLTLMQDTRHREALERGHGLCLKHFAHAYLISPQGKVRSALVALHKEKLQALSSDLKQFIQPGRSASGNNGIIIDQPWQRAVYRFSGYLW